jgi:hypothetical protein
MVTFSGLERHALHFLALQERDNKTVTILVYAIIHQSRLLFISLGYYSLV